MATEAEGAIRGLVRYATFAGSWLALAIAFILVLNNPLWGFLVGTVVWFAFVAFAARYRGGRYRHLFFAPRDEVKTK